MNINKALMLTVLVSFVSCASARVEKTYSYCSELMEHGDLAVIMACQGSVSITGADVQSVELKATAYASTPQFLKNITIEPIYTKASKNEPPMLNITSMFDGNDDESVFVACELIVPRHLSKCNVIRKAGKSESSSWNIIPWNLFSSKKEKEKPQKPFIALSQLESPVIKIKAKSSDLKVSDIHYGDITLKTASGTIECAGLVPLCVKDAQMVNLASGSGDVNVHSSEILNLNIEVGSGKVNLEKVSAPFSCQGMYSLSAGSGNVEFNNLNVLGTTIKMTAGSSFATMEHVKAASLSIETGAGSIKAEDISLHDTQGVLELKTGSGRIVLSNITAQQVKSSTGSSSIEIDYFKPVDAKKSSSLFSKTGSGSQSIEHGCIEKLTVHGMSGSVTLTDVTVTEGLASTASGNIKLAGVKGPIKTKTTRGLVITKP